MTPPAVVTAVVPLWVKAWLGLLTIWLIVFTYLAWDYKKDLYAWNKQMHRWANHYYYCDSAHRDEAKCAQWSDHIPPPPPPPD